MGMLKKGREAAAEKVADDAREAWDAGELAYVARVEAFTSNAGGRLSPIVSAILRIGWQLHSTAVVMNTSGINTEVVFFTFVRPT